MLLLPLFIFCHLLLLCFLQSLFLFFLRLLQFLILLLPRFSLSPSLLLRLLQSSFLFLLLLLLSVSSYHLIYTPPLTILFSVPCPLSTPFFLLFLRLLEFLFLLLFSAFIQVFLFFSRPLTYKYFHGSVLRHRFAAAAAAARGCSPSHFIAPNTRSLCVGASYEGERA